jgi:hypothetical protein
MMGGAKNAMMERQDRLIFATEYLVRKGVLQQCEVHHDVYEGNVDLDDDFWRYAMADKKRGANGPVAWAEDLKPREYTDLLVEARDSHFGDECGYCAKNRYRD